ncbi:homocysteine S-methyltransferase isoform A [Chlorella sorokiniana]|uniref:Homocysteine S-methyltransferase isoform A n=1 Tax=Chlorella sorokiniana TaxID=3076 RepID=A0A2P6U2T1_CHLSO|nr:homocysteine S-methyltransferase isoform B [Chlorella sorokiniana]PRW60620.1 homocysteine S-methyltransferase isoform A [Chlorella sorokiniana]|eukprot:PRW60619.1 homocysteine S-methyltransferase isoform B [Chlorella sorokiniana]
MPVEGDVLLLDGGIGHLLKERGVQDLVPGLEYDELFLAGALANELAPEAVLGVHREYIHAGVDVISVNNFSCTQWSLGRISKADMQLELVEAAARLARDAANEAAALSGGRRVLVAGSLPPLQESYQASGLQAFEEMQPQYNLLAGALKPYCDLLLCETLATVTEGLAAASAASASGLPWWISWTLEDSDRVLLRSGEPLADAVAAVAELPGLEAILVNCCSPQAVTAALPSLKAAAPPGVRIGGYANGFQTTTSEWLGGGSSSDAAASMPADEYDADGFIFPDAYAHHAQHWLQRGASMVGGCCGVGPAHIQLLRTILDKGSWTAAAERPGSGKQLG